jgi:uncharacterized membrane protein
VQVMFQSFQFLFEPIFFTFFIVIFVVVFIMIFLTVILSFLRMMKSSGQKQTLSENQPAMKEREVIREIIKIRCPYCGNLYEEKEDKCPYCGARKP